MMKVSKLFQATLIGLLPLVAGAEGRTLVFGNVSGWAVHTDPATGFTCYAEARYEGESLLRIGFEPDSPAMYLQVSEPTWTDTAPGTEVEVSFDDNAPFSIVRNTAAEPAVVNLAIPNNARDQFLSAFAHGYQIRLRLIGGANVSDEDGGQKTDFSLGGSFSALRMLNECQDSMSEFSGG